MRMTLEKGDKIEALGRCFTVEKILYADLFDEGEYDVEFLDVIGGYHHWKQIFDGGKIIKKNP